MDPLRQSLWQAVVRTREGEQIALGPKTGRDACERIARAFQHAQRNGPNAGYMRAWSDPEIVPIISTRSN